MAIYKAIYKRYNGVSWDEFHFKTHVDQIIDFPTIPTIPDISVNITGSGNVISGIEVDSSNKHKLNITKSSVSGGATYQEMTQSLIDAGTSTTSMVISPKLFKDNVKSMIDNAIIAGINGGY